MEVLVFKTDVSTKTKIRRLKPRLSLLPEIRNWNFDLHDAENILRVEAENLDGNKVENVLKEAGHFCEELE
ncbi:hypothetical protein [Rubrolithibacter danxiaensis]|uniref:hypothetical protein n=1 Tax=Rubrolithibacter danxiaensis TaxID=3390805 RepID=UPI003BF8F6D8